MWFIVKMLWKYYRHDTFFFFYSSIDFGTSFPPPPFSAMPLPQLLNFYFLFPYFGNGIATISLSIFFFFSLRALHVHLGSRIGHRKFGIPVTKIQHFLSPPFSSSLSYFWLNFGNGNTEIQSLPLKSQITLNNSYNAN